MEQNRDTFLSLLFAAQNGNGQAEATLVQQNLPLVSAMAKRFLSRGVDRDDLIQLGSIGLVQAIRRFDASYGVSFSTYAVPLIVGEIKRFLRDDGPIHVTRSLKELSYAAEKAQADDPRISIEELAKRLSVSPADLAMAHGCRTVPLSLDAEREDEGNPLINQLCSNDLISPLHDRILIEELLSHLSEREQTIVSLRYFQERTQTEIGACLGLSQVQISRLEKKILLKLRSHLTEQETVH